jgi:hypothetical protein
MKALIALAAALAVCAPAQAIVVTYQTALSGPAEAPPNASPGTGFATVTFDIAAHLLTISDSFSGLTGTTTASHIHCCTAVAGTGTAGVATMVPSFTGFPLGVTSGTFLNTFDTSLASTYNPSFVTASGGSVAAAELALYNGMNLGQAYLNIHSTTFQGGEIRGFLAPVPEPGTYALMLAGLGVLAWLGRRRS